VINKPSDFNQLELSGILADDSTGMLLGVIDSLAAQGLGERAGRPVFLQVADVQKSAKSALAIVSVLVETAAGILEDTLYLSFDRGARHLCIDNAVEMADKLQEMAASRAIAMTQPVQAKSSNRVAADVASVESPHLFVPKDIYADKGVGRLTYSTVIDIPGDDIYGKYMFNRPYGVCAMQFLEENGTVDLNYLISSDANWDRVIVSESETPILTSVGSGGSDSMQFRHPSGIGWGAFKFFVADSYNGRVTIYDGNNSSPTQIGEQGGFDLPIDLDVALIEGEPGWFYTYVAVVDRTASQVKVFRVGDAPNMMTLDGTYPQDHPNVQFFDAPTSVAWARNRVTHENVPLLYVADTGNRRVICFHHLGLPGGLIVYETDPGVFPENAYLSSVAVDNRCYVYVLDAQNGRIYMFNPSLDELLAVYGSKGTGDGQLLLPNQLEFARAYRYIGDTSGAYADLGEAFTTEHFGDSTGIRRYAMGYDIDSIWLEYIPRYNDWGYDYLAVNWHQSGFAKYELEIIPPGASIHSVGITAEPPGQCQYLYRIPDTAYDGTYTVNANFYNDYPLPTGRWLDDNAQLAVVRSTDTSYHGCRIQVIESEAFAVDPVNGDTNFYPSGSRWYKSHVRAVDRSEDQPIRYAYTQGAVPVQYYLQPVDTLFPVSSIWTDGDVYFKIVDAPSDSVNGCNAAVARVEMDFTSGDTSIWSKEIWEGCGIHNVQHTVYQTYCALPSDPCADSGCPFLYEWIGWDYRFVNNVLPQCELDDSATDKVDYYPFLYASPVDTTYYKYVLTEEENEVSYLDQVSLAAYELPYGLGELAFDSRQRLVLISDTVLPSSAVTNNGVDVRDLLSAEDGLTFVADSQGYLDLTFTWADDTGKAAMDRAPLGDLIDPIEIVIDPPTKIPLDKDSLLPGSTKPNIYTLFARNSKGDWDQVDHVYPRMRADRQYLSLDDYAKCGSLEFRISWIHGIELDFFPVLRCKQVETDTVEVLLQSAIHSAGGEVVADLEASDDKRTILSAGEQIELFFKADPPPEGVKRVYLMRIEGRYESADSSDSGGEGTDLKGITFEQNYPNPFNPATSFSFSLPGATAVTLEIYNVLGQKVATVANGEYPAGRHTVTWMAAEGAKPAASGVYFARLTAGDFTATKKLVVVK
ncbi:MAG: T9SS type A sorting domain-containing protein, partial [candidate division Zixibacteria bacterium]|nr:T9SS type A sorting domain-containing protein [candidate division Zixibacteria bacterium]